MQSDMPIRCQCGAVRGLVRDASGQTGNRVVCYCDDCQSFAHFLEGADEILDENGGSDIFQVSAARVEITEGREHLAGMRLREDGLLRWYTDCCRTPIANTAATMQLPFAGIVDRCMDHASDRRSLDEALGPVRMRVNARFAKGDRTKLDASDGSTPAMLFRLAPMLLMARLRGDHKRSPFFDPASGQPIAKPRVLDAKELASVEQARDL